MKHPVYNEQTERSRCERDLLNQATELSPRCKFNLTTEKNFWINLSKKNQWIYGVKEPSTLNVVCGNEAQSMLLKGSGLLELTPGCELTQSGMTIMTESVKQTAGNFNYYPMVNLSETIMKSGQNHGVKMVNLTLDHTEQLDSLSEQLNTLKQQSEISIIIFHIIIFHIMVAT